MVPVQPLSLALAQIHSTPDPAANIEALRACLRSLPRPVDLAVFPENACCLGNADSVRRAARPEAEWLEALAPAAAGFRGTLVLGGIPVPAPAGKLFNRCLVLRRGRVLARYDKIHRFRLRSPHDSAADETKLYAPGANPVAVQIATWKVGLSICYDLRFPELYRALAPVDLVLVPAAFTAQTGRAHWEVLLRARAIENQCFVAGVNQYGKNLETGMALYGNSMLVDPWGQVLARAPDGRAELLLATLEPHRIQAARNRLPALDDRRLPPT